MKLNFYKITLNYKLDQYEKKNRINAYHKIKYEGRKVGFSVNIKPGTRNLTVENDSKTNHEPATGSVVPLMIEIKHN